MSGVVEIQIIEMELELQVRCDVRDAQRLDDAAPADGVQALRAHRDAEAQGVGGFELDGGIPGGGGAGELGIFGVQKLAIVETVPKLGASAGRGVELALEGLADREVVDGDRDADLRGARGSGTRQHDRDSDNYPQPVHMPLAARASAEWSGELRSVGDLHELPVLVAKATKSRASAAH